MPSSIREQIVAALIAALNASMSSKRDIDGGDHIWGHFYEREYGNLAVLMQQPVMPSGFGDTMRGQ